MYVRLLVLLLFFKVLECASYPGLLNQAEILSLKCILHNIKI